MEQSKAKLTDKFQVTDTNGNSKIITIEELLSLVKFPKTRKRATKQTPKTSLETESK